MPTPVWIWRCSAPAEHEIEFSETQVSCGPGYERTVMSETAHYRADGSGQLASHYGRHVFTVPMRTQDYTAGDFAAIWRFLIARKNAGNEAFYFYNYPERSTPDATGVDTAGRYLVRHFETIKGTIIGRQYYDLALVFREVFE